MAREQVRQAYDLWLSARLRRQNADDIVTELSGFTRASFARARKAGSGALAVVIPVHNGADDLPRTLLSLARTERAVPVVGDNNSTDGSAAIARRMGAIVYSEPNGRKMATTQAGLHVVRDELHADRALLTDDDTLVPKRWPDAMSARLDEADTGHGSVVWGNSLSLHRRTKVVDLPMAANSIKHTARADQGRREPIARGHNWGIKFDSDGPNGTSNMLAAIDGLDKDWFIGPDHPVADDTAIGDLMATMDGVGVVTSMNPDTWVITRNDRVNSLSQVARLALHRASYAEVTAASYAEQYGQI